jgi:pimeloyl-[acyl-carrier protein] methyl ester esterase
MANLTLVLLPGMDGTGELFAPFINKLDARFRTQVIQYPLGEPLDYCALEAFVRSRLPLTEHFALLGESFSGPIAISIASLPPPNLIATILCCTFASNPQPRLALLRRLFSFAHPKMFPVSLVAALLLGVHSTPQLRAALASALSKVTASVFRTRLRAILEVNVTAELGRIQAPVLYLQALKDRLVPAEAAAEVVRVNLKIQIARIDAPHCLLQVCPDAAITAISAFLEAKDFA